jgi:hypothetical protein
MQRINAMHSKAKISVQGNPSTGKSVLKTLGHSLHD